MDVARPRPLPERGQPLRGVRHRERHHHVLHMGPSVPRRRHLEEVARRARPRRAEAPVGGGLVEEAVQLQERRRVVVEREDGAGRVRRGDGRTRRVPRAGRPDDGPVEDRALLLRARILHEHGESAAHRRSVQRLHRHRDLLAIRPEPRLEGIGGHAARHARLVEGGGDCPRRRHRHEQRFVGAVGKRADREKLDRFARPDPRRLREKAHGVRRLVPHDAVRRPVRGLPARNRVRLHGRPVRRHLRGGEQGQDKKGGEKGFQGSSPFTARLKPSAERAMIASSTLHERRM